MHAWDEERGMTYMGGNKICDHVKCDSPPNCSKNEAREVLRASQMANRMINFGKVLEEKHN